LLLHIPYSFILQSRRSAPAPVRAPAARAPPPAQAPPPGYISEFTSCSIKIIIIALSLVAKSVAVPPPAHPPAHAPAQGGGMLAGDSFHIPY